MGPVTFLLLFGPVASEGEALEPRSRHDFGSVKGALIVSMVHLDDRFPDKPNHVLYR